MGGGASRTRALSLALLALTVIAGCAICEVGLRRVRARRLAGVGKSVGPCMRASPVPELIYEYTPNLCGHNSRGFPDEERAIPKPAGLLRVLVIGDSIAAGLGITDHGLRFAGVLETELRRLVPARPLEVAVMARMGYSTRQELYLLEHEVRDYEPDLIVWSYCLNDPADPFYHDANGDLGLYFRRPVSELWELVHRAWFTFVERRRARSCPQEYHRLLHCAYQGEVERSFARIGAWSVANKVPVALLVHALHPVLQTRLGKADAAPFSSYADYPFRDLHASIGALAKRAGLAFLDELDAYGGAPAAELSLPRDPWHPSPRGHQLSGVWLARELVRRGLVRPAEREEPKPLAHTKGQ